MMKGIRKMSVRDYIRALFVDIIKEQLKENSEPSTTKVYQQIIDHGVSKTRAIELLAFYLEVFVKENHFIDEFKHLGNLEEIELDDLIVLRRVLEIVIAMHDKKMAQIKVQKESPEK